MAYAKGVPCHFPKPFWKCLSDVRPKGGGGEDAHSKQSGPINYYNEGFLGGRKLMRQMLPIYIYSSPGRTPGISEKITYNLKLEHNGGVRVCRNLFIVHERI